MCHSSSFTHTTTHTTTLAMVQMGAITTEQESHNWDGAPLTGKTASKAEQGLAHRSSIDTIAREDKFSAIEL